MKKYPVLVALFALACVGMLGAVQPVPMVPFKQSMGHNSQLRASTLKTHPAWKFLENNYESYKKYGKNPHARYLIPRLIHVVNLQGPLSPKEHARVEKLKEMHPTWKVKVWTRADLDALTMRCKDKYEQTNCSREKTALASYEILYACGGLCISPNFQCLKPFDNLHQSAEFYAGIGATAPNPELNTSLIGCAPHHPIIDECLLAIRASKTDATAAEQLTQCFMRAAVKQHGLAVALPVTFFNSLLSVSRENVSPETYAFYHHCQ